MNDYWDGRKLARKFLASAGNLSELTGREKTDILETLISIPYDPKMALLLEEERIKLNLPKYAVGQAIANPSKWPGTKGLHKFLNDIHVTINTNYSCDSGLAKFGLIYALELLKGLVDKTPLNLTVSDQYHSDTNIVIGFYDYSQQYQMPAGACHLDFDEYVDAASLGLQHRDLRKEMKLIPSLEEFESQMGVKSRMLTPHDMSPRVHVCFKEWEIIGSYVSFEFGDVEFGVDRKKQLQNAIFSIHQGIISAIVPSVLYRWDDPYKNASKTINILKSVYHKDVATGLFG